jgi:hypothetical protein
MSKPTGKSLAVPLWQFLADFPARDRRKEEAAQSKMLGFVDD